MTLNNTNTPPLSGGDSNLNPSSSNSSDRSVTSNSSLQEGVEEQRLNKSLSKIESDMESLDKQITYTNDLIHRHTNIHN